MALSDVRVQLRSDQRTYAYGEPLAFTYTVENRSRSARFVVTEPFLTEANGNDELNILLAEAPIPRGLHYFDYEAPTLRRLAPEKTHTSRLSIAVPLLEADTNGDFEVKIFGNVRITLRIGFLKAAFRPQSANPWGEFLEMQEISAPARTRVRIAAQ